MAHGFRPYQIDQQHLLPTDLRAWLPEGHLALFLAEVVGQLDLGFVYVDGSSVGALTDADLKDRRTLAEEGFISIFVALDLQTGRVIAGPEIQARGFAEEEHVFDTVRPQIVQALRDAAGNGTQDLHGYSQVIRRTVGRWVSTKHRRRPMIIPVVVGA